MKLKFDLKITRSLLLVFIFVYWLTANGQGNKLSVQILAPKNISICGINDTTFIQIYNISSGNINSIKVTLNLPTGVYYIKGSFKGVAGVSESNISNLNAPIFNAPNLGVAKNFYFSVNLTAGCGLYNYISNNNSPVVNARADYTGNFDVGNSLPFSAKVPSVNISTIVNQTYTGSVGDVFGRTITIGNFGKGPLRSLTLLRINGSDVKTYKVNQGTTTFSNDSVKTTFGTADFKKVGNLDSFLDQNEVIVIIDSSRILKCNKLSTVYELSWGCLGNTCQLVKNSGIVLISSSSPNISAIPTPKYITCFDNKVNNQLLKITNNGQKIALNTRVSIDQGYYYELSKLDTNTLFIKTGWKGTWKKPVIDSFGFTYGLGAYNCLGMNPIGSFRIKTGDILPKDTIYIIFNNYTCIPNQCNVNFYNNSWLYSIEYFDLCKNKKTIVPTWAKYYDYSIISSSNFTPTDLVNNQKGTFRQTFTSFNLMPYDASASYQYDVILPVGLKHSLNKNDLFFDDAGLTLTWKPDSVVMRKDTLRSYFSKLPFSLYNSELVYYLTADCSKSGANGVKTVNTIFRYSPTNKCAPREWFSHCASYSIKIHCTANCTAGLKFLDFKVNRTSYGKPDNNNDGLPDGSGALDLSRIRAERAMVGDSITSVFQGKILRSRSSISWRYLYAESNIPYGYYLDVASVNFQVFRGGSRRVNCNSIRFKKVTSGGNANFIFDLSIDSIASCIASGFDYRNNDSVSLKVIYRVARNIGQYTVTTQFSNFFYTSDIVNPTLRANKFQCDTFSGQIVLNGYIYYNYGPDYYQLNSCNQVNISQNFYLGIGSNSLYAGNNIFPYEYRNFARMKEIICYLPAGLKLVKATLGQYRTSGSNQYLYQYKDTIAYKVVNNNYIFEISKYYTDSARGKINLSDDAFQGIFNMLITPTCELPNGVNIPIKYDFMFEKKGTLPKGIDTLSSLSYTDNFIFNKPTVSVKPTIPINYAATDTAEWEVIYTNSSSTFNSLNAWFSPDNSGAIKIIEIKDATKDTFLKQVNQIYKAGTMPFNSARKFKVRATYNSCKKDSVILYSGWNCDGYPKDFSSYNCSSEKIVLYLEPQNTQFQVSIADSITSASLCGQTPYYYLLENIGATAAQNSKALLTLPIGMQVVSGKSYVKHPLKNSWALLPNPTLQSGTTYQWNLASALSSLKAGFKGITDTTKNKIYIKFYVKTNCNYSSGNYIRASASGNIKCGNPVLVFPSISNPLNITGVTKPYFSLLKVKADIILPCEKNSKVNVTIINLGPGITGIEDKYQAILPVGVKYDSMAYSATRNAPNNILTVSRNINGATEIEFSLQDSILPGDSMEFSLGLITDSKKVNCGTIDYYSQASVKQSVICVENNTTCKINVVTGNTLLKIPVLKADIQLSKVKSKLQSFASDSETVSLTYTLKNAGNNISSSNKTKLLYYYDKNLSGQVDSGDAVVGSLTINSGIKKDSILNIGTTIKVKSGYSCALFIAVDSSSCACSFNQYKIPVPSLPNAGPDVAFCSGTPNQLGFSKSPGFTYAWQPALELSSDTNALTKITFGNTSSSKSVRRYILTTKRVSCISKDTVFATLYPLPNIKLAQFDTLVCQKQQVKIGAKAKGGSGILKYKWFPTLSVKDSTKLSTIAIGQASTYYRLLVSDSFQCKSTDSLKITIKPIPKSNFTFNTVCYGNLVSLTDSSTIAEDSILSNRWTQSLVDTLDTKTWKIWVPKTLQTNIRLISESPYGCKDTIKKIVTIKPLPIAKIQLQNICFGNTSQFKNQSIGNITAHNWQYGDGNTSNTNDTIHTYNMADTFVVKLKVTTPFGCIDTTKDTIIIFPKPIANFTGINLCFGDSNTYTNISTINRDSITQNEWNLGDNSGVIAKNTTHLYASYGTYNVELKVQTAFGCADTIVKPFTVYPLPRAIIQLDTVCYGKTSQFKELSTVPTGALNSRKWILSNGYQNTNSNFSYRYLVADTLLVQYWVQTDKGCKDSTMGYSMVHQKITPVITTQDNCLDDSSAFINNSIFTKTQISSQKWKLSALDSTTNSNPQFLYSSYGKKNISLSVTSTEGCRYDTTGSLFIFPKPLLSILNTNVCRDNQFNFSATANIPVGLIDSTIWNFNDGTFAYVLSTKHNFPSAGNYQVVFKAKSDFGCIDTVQQSINSYPPVITAFSADSVCFGTSTTFKDVSIVPNATISKYYWQFGDGYKDYIQNPTHLYDTDSTYPVKLQITTSYNCVYDTIGKVRVYPVPKSVFITDPPIGTVVNPKIQFINQSLGATWVKYLIGKGPTFIQDTVNYYFKDSGTYTIKQWAYNQYGCSDSSTKTISINYILNYYLPNAFSPNGDSLNSVLQPVGIGISNYEMIVANRWGEILYQTKDSKGWDGTFMGDFVPEGHYIVWYKIKSFKGQVQYKRQVVTVLR